MNSKPLETIAQQGFGALLWFLSAALSASLFLSFSLGDPVRRVVLVLLALALEGAKVLCWRLGGFARPLAVLLILLSIFASVGSSLQTLALLEEHREPYQVEEDRILQQRRELDQQIQELQTRIEQLPSTWVTWYRTLSSDLAQLRLERSALEVQKVVPEGTFYTRSGIFDQLARYMGLPQRTLELIVLLVMALCLEWAALTLSVSITTPQPSKSLQTTKHGAFKPVTPAISEEEYLKMMVELADGPYLGGRDRVGKALPSSRKKSMRFRQ